MFLQNKTAHLVKLARGDVSPDLCIAAITLRVVHRLSPTGLVPWEGPRPPLDTDPPETVLDQALWKDTSVTIAGTVRGPRRSPNVARVDLHVGSEQRTVLVFGDRQWVRNAGKLVPSLPAPFDEKPLSWALAFGGTYELPPGPDPVTGRPHPGGPVPYILNPAGTGFYRSERAAEGQALPSIERREGGVATWCDQPRPAGFAPCPDLFGLRVPGPAPSEPENPEWHLETMLRFLHHAPGELVFADLAPGAPIQLSGVGPAPVSFEVPRSPVAVSTIRGKSSERVGFRIRAVHVSQEDGAVLVDYAHGFGFPAGGAPSSTRVETT